MAAPEDRPDVTAGPPVAPPPDGPPPPGPTHAQARGLALPRWLAWAWVVGGVVGIVAAVVGAAIGTAFVRDTTEASVQALELTDTVLEAVEETATVLDTTFTDVATTLDTVEGTVDDTTTTLGRVGTTLDDLTVLVTEDVPASLDAVNEAMPQLISTAGVIDSTMRALSFVGVDYDPAAPLDDALRDVDDRLAQIPPDLRAQREGLDEVGTRLDTLAGQGGTIGDDLATLNADLEASRGLVDDFRATATEASGLVDELGGRLESQAGTARWVLWVLALAIAISQTVPIALGLQVLRRDRDPREPA